MRRRFRTLAPRFGEASAAASGMVTDRRPVRATKSSNLSGCGRVWAIVKSEAGQKSLDAVGGAVAQPGSLVDCFRTSAERQVSRQEIGSAQIVDCEQRVVGECLGQRRIIFHEFRQPV